ncbi:MAG: pilus assembly PilX N-terminal domain-containing protein [Candidatus Moranbacteria bacterium]|nr:pilus assembly PilX N-terminal domain-containing protein [Candidatus Moranbacteria bacterium]
MSKVFEFRRGSVLVLSLILMAILLSVAIAVATVSMRDTTSVVTTDKSNQAFQVAGSGAELVMKQIYKSTPERVNLSAIASSLGGDAMCSSGVITKSSVAGGSLRISFYDKDDSLLSCGDANWRAKLVGIKSEGTASGTTRLIETAVAAPADYAWIDIDNGTFSGAGTNHYVRYNSGSHSPDEQCRANGYERHAGACKTRTAHDVPAANVYDVEGNVQFYKRADERSHITCHFWNGNYYFDNDSHSQILCLK